MTRGVLWDNLKILKDISRVKSYYRCHFFPSSSSFLFLILPEELWIKYSLKRLVKPFGRIYFSYVWSELLPPPDIFCFPFSLFQFNTHSISCFPILHNLFDALFFS